MGIREIFMGKREAILAIAAKHGAKNVRVFGSTARGEAGAQSDVDILVAMDPGRSLLDLVALSDELEALLGRPVDVVSDNGVSPYLRERIYAEAVAV
ncbi:MAG: nucleotidyltransferase family protein [Planctomycetes bacterium]|nr:nucleotidyltransferase family protein [Planctomycetota bacterium]